MLPSTLNFSGVLERPTFPLGISSEILSYKLFLYGKAAVGKTSLICKLCGLGNQLFDLV